MTQTIDIERMSYGPDAVGHLPSGKAVFVRGGVPGESCEIEIVEEKPRYAKAVAVGRAVGAIAPWEHLPYDEQLAAKQAIVRDALLRVGHFAPDEVDALLQPIVRCKDEWGYRNKLEMAATRDARGKFALGFHDAESDEVEVVQKCRLGNRLIESAPKAIAGAIRYLCGDGPDLGIYRVGVRGSLATKSVEVALWTPPSAFPRSFAAKMLADAVGATSVVRVVADAGKSRKVKKVEVLAGDGFWRENIVFGDARDVCEFAVSAPSFFQVNTKQAARLVRLALDALDVREGEHVADLYSGVGTFSLPLALSGAKVAAIELEGSAARDLRRNCERARVDVDVVCDDVARALPKLVKRCGGLDGVVVDPPRAGLDRRAIGDIVDARPGRVVYVSCDPQTLARDAGRFRDAGYRLVRTTPVDMFPQTYHVETVNLFRVT